MAALDDKDLRRYLEEALGRENAEVAFSSFSHEPSVSVRLNPFKKGASFECGTKPVDWNPFGLMLSSRPSFTLDPFFHAGTYYVQDSSAMFVGEVFRKVLPLSGHGKVIRVLDLCAAPGGKTTDMAASLRQVFGNDFLLVANEVIKARASVLADNVTLWGDPNVVVTSADPKAFSAFPGFLDIILADVPCSGEGMFRKDHDALDEWSADTVSLCVARQRRILADVWPSLSDEGLLIYSTCTFNRYENDGNVSWMLENLGAEPISRKFFGDILPSVLRTEYGFCLVPGIVEGEGQYCSAVRKSCEGGVTAGYGTKAAKPHEGSSKIGKYFNADVSLLKKGELLIAVPDAIAPFIDVVAQLHPLLSGVAVGTEKGNILVPSEALALTYIADGEAFHSEEVDRNAALAFLHRDTIVLPQAPKGFIRVCYGGLPLGFVKNLGNRCNNLHPQERRIRMNIK
jgi:16S rRNA C967 or C1407 C5-methylase (RsmB/RsmF family)/NOL1/NOP2/fmu family ribosome biogenesis protein